MKGFYIIACLLVFMCACGGEEPVVDNKPEPVCRMVRSVLPSPIVIRMYVEPPSYLPNDFVIKSLNAYWSELGVQVVQTESPIEAHFAVAYIQSTCKEPIRDFMLSYEGSDKIQSIIVDSNCIDQLDGYKTKFPAAVSHVLANLIGIESYPVFCSNGIMASSVRMMAEEDIPQRLSQGDKDSFALRTTFINNVEWVRVCEEPVTEEWETGIYSASSEKKYSFSLDSALVSEPVEAELNKYFKIFGRQFEEKPEAEADFRFKLWNLDDGKSCSPTAMALVEKGEILLNPNCLKSESPYYGSTVVVHETAHLFGMNHIPAWCGNAIMQPFVNPGPSFTPADVKEWQNRDIGSAFLK
ncbi:hypothetical protein KKB41_01130 [Patescibacteria group bacterium]|nr:hypothetical protein [Patescibacteria group bacterium]